MQKLLLVPSSQWLTLHKPKNKTTLLKGNNALITITGHTQTRGVFTFFLSYTLSTSCMCHFGLVRIHGCLGIEGTVQNKCQEIQETLIVYMNLFNSLFSRQSFKLRIN